jgi:hypothetical protein
MAQLSDAQIAAYARQAGFKGTALVIAVAVAIEESGGNTHAHNPHGLDNSYGLWQINMLGAMGPDRRKKYGLKSNEDLFNPATNARVAYSMSNGGKNWVPWTTYTSGKYRKPGTWSRANKAAGTNVEVPAGGSTSGVEQAGLTDIPGAISDFATFISDPLNWLRLGMMVSGGILLLIGIAKMTSLDNKLTSAAMNVGTAVATGGTSVAVKAASAVKGK